MKRFTRWSLSLVLALCLLLSGLTLVVGAPTKTWADPEPNYPLTVYGEWDPASGETIGSVKSSLSNSANSTYGHLAAEYQADENNGNNDIAWNNAIRIYEDEEHLVEAGAGTALTDYEDHTLYVVVTLPASWDGTYTAMADVEFEAYVRVSLIPQVIVYNHDADGLVLGYTGAEIEAEVVLTQDGNTPYAFNGDDVSASIEEWTYNAVGSTKSILNIGAYSAPDIQISGDDAHKYYLNTNPLVFVCSFDVQTRALTVAATKQYNGQVSHPVIPVYTSDEEAYASSNVEVVIPELNYTLLDSEKDYYSANDSYNVTVALSDDDYNAGNGNYTMESVGNQSHDYSYSISAVDPTITLELKDEAHWYYGNRVVLDNESTTHEGETVVTITDAASMTANRDTIFDFSVVKLNASDDFSDSKFSWTAYPDGTTLGDITVTYHFDGTGTNYNTYDATCTVTVAKAPVYVRDGVGNLVYNGGNQKPGESHLELYIYTVDDGFDADTIKGTTGEDYIYADSTQEFTTPGEYDIQITLDNSKLNNAYYELSSAGAKYTIEKKTLYVYSANATMVYGDTIPTLAVNYSGFADNENASNLTSAPYATTTYVQYGDVGEYDITFEGAYSNNYEFDYSLNSYKLTVNARPVTITSQDNSSVYGSAINTLVATNAYTNDGSKTGIVNGDSVYTLVCYEDPDAGDPVAISTTTAAGAYRIQIVSANNSNYLLTSIPSGFYTITNATLTGVSAAQTGSLTYNGAGQTATVETAATAVNSQEVTFTYSDEEAGIYTAAVPAFTTAGAHIVYYKANAASHAEATGTFTVTIANAALTNASVAQNGTLTYNGLPQAAEVVTTGATTLGSNNITYTYSTEETGAYSNSVPTFTNAGNNYTVYYKANAANHNEASGSFTVAIGKKTLTVSADNKAVIYGDEAPAYTYQIAGFENNETEAVLIAGNFSIACGYAQFSSNGTYPIMPGGFLADNYAFNYVNGTLTVSPKAITVTIVAKESVYGSAQVELTATTDGIVNDDENVYTLSCSVTATSNVGSYNITGTEVNHNYAITFVGEENAYTVTKKALVIRSESKAISYGDAAPTYTVTYTGFVNGQTKDDLTGELVFTCDYVQFADAGSYEIYPTGFTSSNYQISFYSDELTVSPKAITVTITPKTSIYGNAPEALAATDDGIVNGDTNVYSLACDVTATTGVGTYAITGTALDTNYNITFAGEENAYTVTKRQLTITADDKSSVYGEAMAELTATISGRDGTIANGDDIYTLSTEATQYSDATTYTITVAKKNDSNYDLTLEGGVYTITTRAITVILSDKNSVYGNELATLTGSVPNDSPYTVLAQDGQVYGFSTTASSTASVGTYAITGNVINTNYAVTFWNTARTEHTAVYTINARPITITIVPKTSVYGSAQVALTADESAIINGDANVYTLSCSVTATSPVGNYNINGVGTSDNYSITFAGTENAYSVTPKALTITADDKNITYGDAKPEFTVSFDGFVNSDNAGVLTGQYSYTCTYAQYSNVGQYSITPLGVTSTNYNIEFEPGTLTVSAKAATVTIDSKSSAYGDARVELTATASGIVNGDNAYTLNCVVTSTSPVGYYNITGTAANNNYNITFVNETNSYSVTKRDITVTADSKDITYGDAKPATFTASATNLANSQTVASLGTITYACSYVQYNDAGEYTITPSGLNSDNYNISYAAGTLTVNPKAITVTITPASSTYGSEQAQLSATVTGLVNGDTNVYALHCSVSATSNAGSYNITGETLNNNYNITFAGGNNAYTVNKKALTITAENRAITYGDAKPAFAVGTSGFVNNDTIASLSGTLAYTCSYAQYNAVGTYPIEISGLTSTNYNIEFEPGTLTVSAKAITVTITPKTSVYGSAPAVLGATDNGIVNNDNVYTLSCPVTATTEAGTYKVTGTANNTNYLVTFVGEEGAYTVTSREITLIWGATEFVYNENPQCPTATAGGTLAGDIVEVTVTGAQTTAGTYTATATALNNPNYKLPQNVTRQFVITKPTSYTSKPVDEQTAKTTGVDVSGILENIDTTDANAKLELKVGSSSVTFDKAAIGMIAENDNVKLKMETKTGADAAAMVEGAEAVFDISLQGATFEAGKATVTAEFVNNAPAGKVAKLYYVDGNGNKTDMNATFADGKVTFKTNHFSMYAVIYEDAGSSALLIIIIIVVVLIAAGLVVFFILRKKKAQSAPEAAEEQAEEGAEDGKDAVTFGDKKTMNEEYALLSKEDRKLYDRIKAHALTLENVKTSEAQNYYTVSYNKEKVVRFKLKRGEIIAEFFSNDKEFKELAGAKAKETASTKIKVKTEEDANKVMEIIDYKFKALSEAKDEEQ